ncbi:MAG: tetratricopeptide repeat protein [Gammaproteobacteria bacterium]|nr:tetratricopeptide repeat protein [Gammaproteobacteria bacterium]
MTSNKAIKLYREGCGYQQKGNLSSARNAYRKAIKFNPDFTEAYNNLGNVLMDLGQVKEAANAFRKAQRLLPQHPMLQHNLARALQVSGDNSAAVHWYNKSIEGDSGFVGNYINLGNALRHLGKLQEALSAYQHAVEISPDSADCHYNLGALLIDLADYEQAITHLERAVQINPGHYEAHNGLGNAFGYHGEIEQAISCYRKAIDLAPGYRDAHNGLGNMFSDSGEIEQAISAFRKAIEIDPGYADAYRSLAKLKKFSVEDEDSVAMEVLYADGSINAEQKMHLAFALGKAFEDIGQFEKSMDYILMANRLKRKMLDFSISQAESYFNHIKEIFSVEFLKSRNQWGYPDSTPIFILGMPRSGTSLVEQILASHIDVYGAGELPLLSNLAKSFDAAGTSNSFPMTVPSLDQDGLVDLGKCYIDNIRMQSEKCRYITDKMPQNFLLIGFIKLILPEAKIIHCTRDPMDNCLSLFKNYFIGTLNFSYELGELGQYYRLYRDIMAHWERVLPGFIYHLNYEQLITDPEDQVAQMLKFCDLDWSDDCLLFYKQRRAVRTASNAQVRQPIYRDSIELWKRYERQLQPLQAIIND